MKTVLLIVLLALLIPLLLGLPGALDWHYTYRPAARAVAAGQSPYSVEIYYAAPWAAWLLVPFALLPETLGRILTFLLGLYAFAFTAWRAGASPVTTFIFLCSAGVIGCLINGNVEWLSLLAITCPPWLGLILAAVKPQVGIGLGLYWVITTWRDEGIMRMLQTVAPVTFLLALSFWMYGFWFMRFTQAVAWSTDNTSLGVQGIFIGGVLLMRALRTRDDETALAAGPFLSPYALHFTWSACLVGLLRRPWELLIAVICLWIPVILKSIS